MKGILFKPDMLRAIREGRKTQTRRQSGLEEVNKEPDQWVLSILTEDGRYGFANRFDPRHLLRKPPYFPGETVYVKEAWYFDAESGLGPIYKAGPPELRYHCEPKPWNSPLFLPEKFARTFLLIKSVRPERLQEITNDDAWAEAPDYFRDPHINYDYENPRDEYADIWNFINKKAGTRWEDSPYVWRIEFAPEGKK